MNAQKIEFSKLQSAGNDYIYIFANSSKEFLTTNQIQKLCQRHHGIGADGVIYILPSQVANYAMRIFNSDGSDGAICANGILSIGKLLSERNLLKENKLSLETVSGIKQIIIDNNFKVTANMGKPELESKKIPCLLETKTGKILMEPFSFDNLDVKINCVSFGNPLTVIYLDQINIALAKKYGPIVENHQIFPKKTNVIFACVINKNEIQAIIWERGSGLTYSSGTGASAVMATAFLNKFCNEEIKINFPGGTLETKISNDLEVNLSGYPELVFTGCRSASFAGA